MMIAVVMMTSRHFRGRGRRGHDRGRGHAVDVRPRHEARLVSDVLVVDVAFAFRPRRGLGGDLAANDDIEVEVIGISERVDGLLNVAASKAFSVDVDELVADSKSAVAENKMENGFYLCPKSKKFLVFHRENERNR